MFFNKESFADESNRIMFLKYIQDKVLENFPEETKYNVIIFGSFCSGDFNSLTSDIDIGILSYDEDMAVCLLDFIKNLISCSSDIGCDVIMITSLDRGRFICYNILTSPYRMTDYFPTEIYTYLFGLRREYQDYILMTEKRRYLYKLMKAGN